MRVKKDKINLDYEKTKAFFRNRSEKYNDANPYAATMFQDDHPELVVKRDKYEKDKLYPLLKLNANSKILDLACGIGRWADMAAKVAEKYVGIDFSEELISIANSRNKAPNISFRTGSALELPTVLDSTEKFNRILIVGLFMYLNDEDIFSMLRELSNYCEPDSIICIRDPMGIKERLTVRDHFSNELKDDYHAIYRTRDEVLDILDKTLLQEGFVISEESFLFDDKELNNRIETAQYYFVLERNMENENDL